MPAYIAKQPNGLYCRFSTVVDTVTHWNLTEQDVIGLYVEEAIKSAKERAKQYLKCPPYTFNNVINDFRPYNDTIDDFEKLLKEMGYEHPLTPEHRKYLKEFEEPSYKEARLKLLKRINSDDDEN